MESRLLGIACRSELEANAVILLGAGATALQHRKARLGFACAGGCGATCLYQQVMP
jgi:hypothetical protein